MTALTITQAIVPTQEILTRKLPYHEIANEMQVLIAIVSGRTPMRPSPDLNARYKDLWKICEICWANEPQERPSAEEIYAVSVQIYSGTAFQWHSLEDQRHERASFDFRTIKSP